MFLVFNLPAASVQFFTPSSAFSSSLVERLRGEEEHDRGAQEQRVLVTTSVKRAKV